MRRAAPITTLCILATSVASMHAVDVDGVSLHGFVSQGYMFSPDKNFSGPTRKSGSFELNEFGINATANPYERVRLGIQITGYDLGNYGNDNPLIDWAYGHYQVPEECSWLDVGVTAGRFKIRHGFFNDSRDLDFTRSSVFLPMTVYNPYMRDLFIATNGFGLDATIQAGALGSFELFGYMGQNNLDAKEGALQNYMLDGVVSPARGISAGQLNSMRMQRMDGGSLQWNTPVDGLKGKFSAVFIRDLEARGSLTMRVPPFIPTPTSYAYTVDIPLWYQLIGGAEWQLGDLTLDAEYQQSYFSFDAVVAAPAPFNAPVHTSSMTHSGYISASYRLPELAQAKWLKKFELYGDGQYGYYSDWKTTTRDENSRDKSYTLGLKYDVTNHLLIKASFERHFTGSMLMTSQNNYDFARGGDPTNWNLFALKVTFDF
jgi:hypothetical protein